MKFRKMASVGALTVALIAMPSAGMAQAAPKPSLKACAHASDNARNISPALQRCKFFGWRYERHISPTRITLR